MSRKRTLVLLGNSVILGTFTASLRSNNRFAVFSVSADLPEAQLKKLIPDVIVFDLEAARPQAAFSMLESLPGLLLVGISPDANVVRVWSGQQLRELSTQDLMKVIEGQQGGLQPSYEGKALPLEETDVQELRSQKTSVPHRTTDTTNGGGKSW